jgi:hypothetical protein
MNAAQIRIHERATAAGRRFVERRGFVWTVPVCALFERRMAHGLAPLDIPAEIAKRGARPFCRALLRYVRLLALCAVRDVALSENGREGAQ